MKTSLQLDPQTTALVLIDLEHGIVSRPLQPHSGEEVVSRCARLAEATRAGGGTVVYVHVKLSEILALPADQPMRDPNTPPPPAQASELVPECGYQAGTDLLITKRQWGAFYGTELDQLLRRRGVKTIILAGIATNFGVESTARAGFDQGYGIVFAEDAMTTTNAEMHRLAVEHVFPVMGRVRTAAEVAEALRA